MQSQHETTASHPLKQCGLYTSVAMGIPALFMSLGIISSEQVFTVLDWSFALLGMGVA